MGNVGSESGVKYKIIKADYNDACAHCDLWCVCVCVCSVCVCVCVCRVCNKDVCVNCVCVCVSCQGDCTDTLYCIYMMHCAHCDLWLLRGLVLFTLVLRTCTYKTNCEL